LAEQLLQLALRRVADDAGVRGSLPLGVAVSDPAAVTEDLDLVRARVLEALDGVDAETLAAALAPIARSGQRAAPIGPLHQLRAAGALDSSSRLTVRPYLSARVVDRPDGGLTVASRAGDVTITQPDRDAFSCWWRAGSGTAGELGLGLARTLLLTGLAVPG
jgi:hypothetical protein